MKLLKFLVKFRFLLLFDVLLVSLFLLVVKMRNYFLTGVSLFEQIKNIFFNILLVLSRSHLSNQINVPFLLFGMQLL